MRAVVLTGHGGPDRLEYRTDVRRPSVGPDEVLIRLRASAVNNTDIAFRENWYDHEEGTPGEPDRWPRIQGAGGAGIVEEVGVRVGDLAPGDVVLVDPFLRHPGLAGGPSLIALMGAAERDGCFADYVTVPRDNAVPAASELTFAELACLPTAYQTAEEMQLRAGVDEGWTVLVTGASGGVGSANVELAKLRGATVIAVAGSSKRAGVEALGADHVIDRPGAHAEDVWGDLPPVDAVLDVTGGELTQTWLEHLVTGGVYVTAGAIAGWSARIDLRTLIYNDLTVIGQVVARREALVNLIRYAGEGRLTPRVARVFGLDDLPAAQAFFAAKDFVGKVVVEIDDAASPARP